MKDFADDNFNFDENGRKLSKLVENTVGKGEIARYEQFLLFPQCFQKACFPLRQKVSLCGNGLRYRFHPETFTTQLKILTNANLMGIFSLNFSMFSTVAKTNRFMPGESNMLSFKGGPSDLRTKILQKY